MKDEINLIIKDLEEGHLKLNGYVGRLLLDYITNLQEYNQIYNIDNKEVEEIINKNDILKKYFINLKHEIIDANKYRDEIEILRKENFKLKEEKENQAHTIKTLLEENDNLRNTIKNDDYTIKKLIEGNKDVCGRNKKAIEYIKNDWYELNTRDIEHCINLNKDIRIDLLNILQGSDNNE